MRPKVKFLEEDLVKKIIAEAIDLLCNLGIELHNKDVLSMLADNGATVDQAAFHVKLTEDIIEKAIKSAPGAFRLYDAQGNESHHFSDHEVYFAPGSAALHILDHDTNKMRKPLTEDYIKYVKLVSRLDSIAAQSTAMIPSDVVDKISDSYRLFLSLLYGEKPVVTGTFTIEAFEVMKDMQVIARGSEKALAEKPLTIFSCCPTSPLKWSDVTSQNVVDCARYGIPVEFISMPLSGFMAPVTITGTLIQHTAETLSGVVISQLANPGTPFLYGGSPAIFDIRYETTPMGAIETMMIDCAYNEIGKYLGFPTQAYISLSDSKLLDAQAGLETGMGAILAALAGINNISGPGMLDFESCQCLEKLVVDNEICRMVRRMVEGITPKEDFPAMPIFQQLLKEDHLLIADHTRRYLKEEIGFPGKVIDRANRARWQHDGEKTIGQRAHEEVERHLKDYKPVSMKEETKNEVITRMEAEARKYGQDNLPQRTQ